MWKEVEFPGRGLLHLATVGLGNLSQVPQFAATPEKPSLEAAAFPSWSFL
jgi:hypothetical protein